VVSALGGITDLLLQCCQLSANADESYKEKLKEAEQRHLQEQLGIHQPFIFENGSAAAIPQGFFLANLYLAARREQGYDIVVFAHADVAALHTALARMPEVSGYAAASDAEMAAATGLTGDALGRARERWFTETLLTALQEDEAVAIGQRLQPAGFSLSRGGRFYTVQSEAVNKGQTVQWMMEIFRHSTPNDLSFAAVGDSLNDFPMLQAVDLPFLVQHPDQTWATMDIPHLTRIEAVGPAGFSAVVSKLVNR